MITDYPIYGEEITEEDKATLEFHNFIEDVVRQVNSIEAQSNAYIRSATVVEDRTLLASSSATATNNNNVLAALIADLQASGLIG